MRDRSEQILRFTSLALTALLLALLVRAGCRAGSLVGVKIPPVPVLETNSVAGTNSPATSNVQTPNAVSTHVLNANLVNTNAVIADAVNTNAVKAGVAATNVLTNGDVSLTGSNHVQTAHDPGTNVPSTHQTAQGTTNAVNQTNHVNHLTASGTNSAGQSARRFTGSMPPGMGFGGFPMMPGMAGNAPKLPPEIQACVDKIVNSEIFAPVMHPLPMALLGIAGNTAFLRTADGQTGLVKAGDSLGDLKLLRIGINRVLVEQAGQRKELMIFDGYGGESLLQNDTSHENTHP
jgi:hypothetical protein